MFNLSSMEQEHKLLLALLRMVVKEQADESIPTELDWEKLMNIATTQVVPVIVLDGLQYYHSIHPDYIPFASLGLSEKSQKRMQWIGQVMAFERMYAMHERAMTDLARLYASKGIRMMVLKGYGLSLDWPIPNHRAVGDLDIYNFGKWKEADAFISEQLDIKVDDGHEHHTVFCFKGLTVENHYDFINTKAHRDAPKIEAHLKSLAEKNCRQIEIEGIKIYLPSANFNVIFLIRHMGQHFAGEHLNLRQMLDWGFFIQAHHEEIDWNGVIVFLKDMGIYTFFNQINAICVDYLGLSEKDFPAIIRDQELEERILMDILCPEFDEKKPNGSLFTIVMFKLRRWWVNRWKHQLVYNDNLPTIFATLALSHLKRIKTIKD